MPLPSLSCLIAILNTIWILIARVDSYAMCHFLKHEYIIFCRLVANSLRLLRNFLQTHFIMHDFCILSNVLPDLFICLYYYFCIFPLGHINQCSKLTWEITPESLGFFFRDITQSATYKTTTLPSSLSLWPRFYF